MLKEKALQMIPVWNVAIKLIFYSVTFTFFVNT